MPDLNQNLRLTKARDIWTPECDDNMFYYNHIFQDVSLDWELERTLDYGMTMVCSWQGGLELCKSKPVPPLLPLDGAQMQSSLSPPFHNNTLIKSYLILAYLIISYSCLKSNFFGLKFLFLLNVKSIENQKKLCFQTVVFVNLQLYIHSYCLLRLFGGNTLESSQ